MSKKPYGLDHPTWEQPTCFFHDTAEEAAAAAERTYGKNSGHTVVGPVAAAESFFACSCGADRPEDCHVER